MDVWPAEERERLERDGWAVLPEAVPEPLVAAAREAVCAFLGVELDDRESWYRVDPRAQGFVPLHHAQAFWDVRQHPRVHAAFAELWGDERLWVTIDRAHFRPPLDPARPEHAHGRRIHWDRDPFASDGRFFQGVLYLADTSAEQGGFECVPALFRGFDDWVAANPGGNWHVVEAPEREVVRVAGRAGDLVVWDWRLAHGAGANRSDRPRIAQYVTMFPPDQAQREERIECWRERRAPAGMRGFPGQLDPEPGAGPAELGPLGRKLLGLDEW